MLIGGCSLGRDADLEAQLVRAAGRGGGCGEESEELLSLVSVAIVPR